MASQPPCNDSAGALIPFHQPNNQHPSCPSDEGESSEQDKLRQLQRLLVQGLSNDDVCIKLLNDSWASNSDWYRRIYEQVVSSRHAIEQRLYATTQQLNASQTTLHQEVASCMALQQALSAEKAKSAAGRDKMDELSVRYTLCKEANVGLMEANMKLGEANAHLSKALYNLTSLDEGVCRMSDA